MQRTVLVQYRSPKTKERAAVGGLTGICKAHTMIENKRLEGVFSLDTCGGNLITSRETGIV